MRHYFSYLEADFRAGLELMGEAFRIAAAADTGRVRPQFIRLSDAFARALDELRQPVGSNEDNILKSHRKVLTCLDASYRMLDETVEAAKGEPKAAPVIENMNLRLKAANILISSGRVSPVPGPN